LKHCSTSWKVAGLILDGVTEIFHWHNPSGCTVALGGKGGWCIGLTTLSPYCADCLKIWEPQPPGTCRACPGLYRDCFDIQTYVSSISFEKNTGFLLSFSSCNEPIIQKFSTILYIVVSYSTVDEGFFLHHSDCNFSHDMLCRSIANGHLCSTE